MGDLLASAALAEAHHDYRTAVARYDQALDTASGALRREAHLRRLAAIRTGGLADIDLRAAAAIEAATGDLESEIEVRLELARIAHAGGRFAQAIALALEARARVASLDDEDAAAAFRATAHHIVGQGRRGLGQVRPAHAELEAAVAHYRELADETNRAAALRDLADLQHELDQLAARERARVVVADERDHRLVIGRQRECASLDAALARAARSQGSLWLLKGEAGIGKTRLCEEIDRRAHLLGFTTLWGRCWDPDAEPYAPWVELVKAQLSRAPALFAELGPLSDGLALLARELSATGALPVALHGRARAFHVAESVLALLLAASAASPLVVFLDDLHAADRTSLELLQLVARELRHAPIVVIGTYRGIEARFDEGVRRELVTLGRTATTLALTGLTEEETAILVGDALPLSLIAVVHQRSQGNPLFAQELAVEIAAHMERGMLASSTTELPLAPAVSDVIVGRLQHVSPAARHVLEAAAIAGRTFVIPLVAQLCGWNEAGCLAAMEEGLAAGLVADGGAPDTFRFVDSLVRAALYREIPPARRAELHLAFAEAVEPRYTAGSEPRYAELARHFAKAPAGAGRERAARYHRLAGERAAAHAAFPEAAKHLSAALQAIDALGAEGNAAEHCRTLVALGNVQVAMGHFDLSAQMFARAAELARPLGPAVLAQVALELGRMHHTPGQPHTLLVSLCTEALSGLDEREPALRARLHARLSVELMFTAHADEREAHGRTAIAIARASSDPSLLARTLYSASLSLWTVDNLDERLVLAAELDRAATAAATPALALRASHARVLSQFELDDLAAVEFELARLGRLSRELRDPHYEWLATSHGAALALVRGRLDEADRLAQCARSLADRIEWKGEAEMVWLLQCWRLRREQGRLPELRERAEQALSGGPSWFVDARYVVASIRLACGDRDGTRSLYDELLADGVHAIPRDMRWIGSMVALAELAIAFRDVPTLRELYDVLLPYEPRNAMQGPGAVSYGPVALTLGQIATALERGELARAHLERALECGQRNGSLLVTAHAAACFASLVDAPLPAPSPTLTLVREANLWRVTFGEKPLWVRDAKGMAYLAELVRRPGESIHVAQLASSLAGEELPVERDAGEMLDARARAEYHSRLETLERALTSADSRGTAESVRAEIDFLRAELSRAEGLGGRARRALDRNERLRQSVTKRLREAIRKIADQDSAAGMHLSRCVRTGVHCAYCPRD